MRTLIFDTETTGLSKNSVIRLEKQPHITEFFGLTLNEDLEEVEVWQSLFKQGAKLSDLIVKITGITDKLLEDAPLFFSRADELKKYIESHDCVVGHNLSFDIARIDQEMKRANRSVVWPKERICTVEQTESIFGYRLSLTALHEYLFGVAFPDAHRAEPDVRALTKCFIEMKNRELV